MKRIVCISVAVAILSGCGEPLTVSSPARKTYPTYGFLNENTERSKDVCYRLSVGNLLWSIVLFETVLAPVYFIGFSLWNPVRVKRDASDTCDSAVDR